MNHHTNTPSIVIEPELSGEDAQNIVWAAGIAGRYSTVDGLFVWLLLVAGADPSLLLALRNGDLDPDDCTLTLQVGSSNECILPIPELLCGHLRDFITAQPNRWATAPLFTVPATKGPRTPMTLEYVHWLVARASFLVGWPAGPLAIDNLRNLAINRLVGELVRSGAQSTDLPGRAVAAAMVQLWGGNHPWLR